MNNNELLTRNGLFRIPMQFFAEGGEAGTDNADNAADNQTDNNADNNADNKANDTADLDKLVQARADKITAEMGKKNAALQKELDKLKKANKTAEEIKQLEMSEKEKELAEREKMLLDKENRLFALKAIKEAGLDDGSSLSLELVDFVIADNEEAITNKVKAFGELVKKFVKSEVDETFKKNGRNPNGGNSNNGADDKGDNSVAEKLGKARAERNQKSNDILKYYTGR